MIRRFINDIEKAIKSHPAILSSSIQKQSGPDGNAIYLKGVITFTDLAILEFSVFAAVTGHKIVLDKYRFQYMDKSNHIIFRYDNAPHHRELASFPHHKHVPGGVIPALLPTLADVLNEISAFMLRE